MVIDLRSYGAELTTVCPSRPCLMHHSTQQQTIPTSFRSARIHITNIGAAVKSKTSEHLGLRKTGIKKIGPYVYDLVCVCVCVWIGPNDPEVKVVSHAYVKSKC